jgi:hypothetical protein
MYLRNSLPAIFLLLLAGCSKGTLRNPKNALIPVVLSVTPATGLYTGGTKLTITGTGFANPAQVLLGRSVCAAIEYVSDSTIRCTTLSASAGPVDVTVVNPNQLSSTLHLGFAFIEPAAPEHGFAVTAGGGNVAGTERRLSATAGEPTTGTIQRGTGRILVPGVQGTSFSLGK